MFDFRKAMAFGAALVAASSLQAQIKFDPSIDTAYATEVVTMPANPLDLQVLFIGAVDEVQTVDANGQPDGTEPAKQWHDFIGFTPDDQSNDLGWVSVNHERIEANEKIGDGGGMTAFKIRRENDSLVIVDQTLSDGRSGKFFNVDFVNTVGETGMNCGGIVSPTGRIWTAEEWFRTSTSSIHFTDDSGKFVGGVRDTMPWTIDAPEFAGADFDGQTVPKFENFNYMVEIDPREAKAVRKQYNWARQPFEGGAFAADNKTVYLGADNTPGYFSKFVADQAGDFTSGKLYFYKEDNAQGNRWVEVDNSSLTNMLRFTYPDGLPTQQGATMFNRIEWVARDPETGKIYFNETGRDNPGGRWKPFHDAGATHASHNLARATAQGTHPDSTDYTDYYGRVMEYDPATEEVSVFIEGGPDLPETVDVADYPEQHLSNPDGLNFMQVGDKTYMIICEDLNGEDFGRVPAGTNNRTCELWLHDMDNAPTVDNLIRIAVIPQGAEVTGAIGIDEKTMLVNVQHPSTENPFPYNNSVTIAINGFDRVASSLEERSVSEDGGFSIFPNPVARTLNFNRVADVAIYSAEGQRVRVARNVRSLDVSDLSQGLYFVRNAGGETRRLVIE